MNKNAVAAEALRHGLAHFWTDPAHWAKAAFYRPVPQADGSFRDGDVARCVQQMIADSIRAVLPDSFATPAFAEIKGVTQRAVVDATGYAFDPTTTDPESALIAVNDGQHTTYDQIRGYVEKAAQVLENA